MERLSESLVDQSLVELVRSSADFDAWLRDRLGLVPQDLALSTAATSVWQGNGESDVVITWASTGDETVMALLESKVNVAFQPYQGQRYAIRAQQLVSEGKCIGCVTAVVAPATYLRGANAEASWFNARVAIEEVVDAASLVGLHDHQAVGSLRAIMQRAEEGGALGAKGLYPDVHNLLSQACEGTGLRISNNATDWVFFEHPDRIRGLELRYRIKASIPEIAFTPAYSADVEALLHRAPQTFTTSRSGSYRFVRAPLAKVDATDFSPAAAQRVVAALSDLMSWWRVSARRDV